MLSWVWERQRRERALTVPQYNAPITNNLCRAGGIAPADPLPTTTRARTEGPACHYRCHCEGRQARGNLLVVSSTLYPVPGDCHVGLRPPRNDVVTFLPVPPACRSGTARRPFPTIYMDGFRGGRRAGPTQKIPRRILRRGISVNVDTQTAYRRCPRYRRPGCPWPPAGRKDRTGAGAGRSSFSPRNRRS